MFISVPKNCCLPISSPAPPPLATVDPVLSPWLQASDDAQAETLLAEVITEQARPVIQQVVGFKLRAAAADSIFPHGEDLCSEIVVKLIEKLHQLKQGGQSQPINNFRSYVAVIAHHACSEHLRRKYPQRWRLQDQLRYVLTHQPSLALWESEKRTWLSGLAVWRVTGQPAISNANLETIAEHWLGDGNAVRVKFAPRGSSLTELLAVVFQRLGGPLEFPSLVKLVAKLKDVKDETPLVWESQLEQQQGQSSAPASGHTLQIEQRLYLQRLWDEIRRLPLPNRAALLLNLRDAEDKGLIVLLTDLKIVTPTQLAEALALAPERFVELWNRLPLDDAQIATHLGVTRQQVINLRKAARRWLVRRINGVAAPD